VRNPLAVTPLGQASERIPVVTSEFAATITALGTLIVAIGGATVAVGTFWLAARNRRDARKTRQIAEDNKAELVRVGDKIYRLSENVDGKLTRLLDLTEKAAHAEGRLEGIAAEKVRVAEVKSE
jgi:Ca2+-binding RTX toxin-like protein